MNDLKKVHYDEKYMKIENQILSVTVLVGKNDYDLMLRHISNWVNSDKKKQLSNEIKLDEHISFYKKVINKIAKEVSQVPAKDK